MSFIIVCDKCKKASKSQGGFDPPSKWGAFHVNAWKHHSTLILHVCEECVAIHGFTSLLNDPENPRDVQLMELICDIASDVAHEVVHDTVMDGVLHE